MEAVDKKAAMAFISRVLHRCGYAVENICGNGGLQGRNPVAPPLDQVARAIAARGPADTMS